MLPSREDRGARSLSADTCEATGAAEQGTGSPAVTVPTLCSPAQTLGRLSHLRLVLRTSHIG